MDDSTLSPLARSFRRHLRAENRAATTIETYLAGVRQAEDFLRVRGKELVTADRADLEAFIGDLLGRRAASTAWTYYKVLRILYAWLVEEQEIDTSPMARMKPPIMPEQPVPVVPDAGVRRPRLRGSPRHRDYPAAARYRPAPWRAGRCQARRRGPGPGGHHRAGQGTTVPLAPVRPQGRRRAGPLPSRPGAPPPRAP